MKKLVALVAIVSFATVAQAGLIVNVSAATQVTDPFNGALLDSYTVSLTATGVGEKVIAVDVRFNSASQLHQEMSYKPGFLPPHYIPTAMNDMAAAGFPAEYIIADTHFLMTTGQVVWPGAAATEDLDETILPRDSFDVWHSYGTFLESHPMGFAGTIQASTVQLAQIVIPRGSPKGTVLLTGVAATNLSSNPLNIGVIEIPEPATLGLLALGGLAVLRQRRA